MKRSLSLPRAKRTGGDPVIEAFRALGDRKKPHDFMIVVDQSRSKRAQVAANAARSAIRFAARGLAKLFRKGGA